MKAGKIEGFDTASLDAIIRVVFSHGFIIGYKFARGEAECYDITKRRVN